MTKEETQTRRQRILYTVAEGEFYRHNNRKITVPCRVCNTPIVWGDLINHSYINENSGGRYVIQSTELFNPVWKDGRIIGATVQCSPRSIVACSDNCRKQWILENGAFYNVALMEGVGIPRGVRPNVLDELVDDNNGKIITALKTRLDKKKGFFFQGIPGCGKTTLAVALALEYRLRCRTVRFVPYEELHFALLSNRDFERQLMQYAFRGAGDPWDVVVVDDISNDFPGQYGRERMKLLFSQWYNNRSTCIFTSNASVDVVGNAVAPMVASRLKELCAIVPMPEIDYRENEPAPEEEIIQ
jgi:hypothetical protein